jgi:hypothetical protein
MSFLSVLKDIGTSSVRIVTDTAIDVGNVATGFQFNESMESAKKSMDDVGLKSASTAIKDNHYSEIDTISKELTRRGQSIQKKLNNYDQQNTELNDRVNLYQTFSDRAFQINLLQNEINHLINITRGELPELENFKGQIDQLIKQEPSPTSNFNAAQRALVYSSLVTSFGSTAGLATAAMSSTAKTVKIAGRASAILAVASVGLDVGMAFASYEKELKKLREMRDEAIADEGNIDVELTSLQNHNNNVNEAIQAILNACNPQQQEQSFLTWADHSITELKDIKGQLEKQARSMMENIIATLTVHGQTDLPMLMNVAKTFLPDFTAAELQIIVEKHMKGE